MSAIPITSTMLLLINDVDLPGVDGDENGDENETPQIDEHQTPQIDEIYDLDIDPTTETVETGTNDDVM